MRAMNAERRRLCCAFAGMLACLLLAFAPVCPAHAAAADKAKAYASDTAITTELKTKFLAEKDLDSLDIKVTTEKGVVTLRGQVVKASQAGLAEKIARNTKGVRSVQNKISVMP